MNDRCKFLKIGLQERSQVATKQVVFPLARSSIVESPSFGRVCQTKGNRFPPGTHPRRVRSLAIVTASYLPETSFETRRESETTQLGYEPSLSICLSSLVLWKLISSRSCSSMVGGLVRPDDELLARVAMPSPLVVHAARFLLAIPAACSPRSHRHSGSSHTVLCRDARVSSNHGWPRDADTYEPYETIEVIVNRLLRSASRRYSFLYPRFSPTSRRGCHCRRALLSLLS